MSSGFAAYQHRFMSHGTAYLSPRPPRKRILACLAIAAVAMSAASPVRADLEVNVTHVGFPAVNEQGDVYRVGDWVPIIVDVSLVGQASFDGTIRTAQLDGDGDEAADSVELHLRSETGGTQRVFLYTIPNPAYENRGFSIEVRDSDGNLVPVVSNGEVSYRARPDGDRTVRISHDDVLILSVSSGTLGRVGDLVTPELRPTFRQPIYVAHTSPENLPELHLGLQMVDYIVWDDARPEDLTQKQLEALMSWVRHGGTLLLAASKTAGSLRLSEPLREALPVELGDLVTVDNLPMVRETLLSRPRKATEEADASDEVWLETPFPTHVPVVQCKVRGDARVVQREDAVDSDVITRRSEGRGHIIFSAITLRDLFSAPCEVSRFFRRLFYLLRAGANEQPVEAVSLFDEVASVVGFSASGSLYLLLAGCFSVAYVAVATFGLWGYLRRRGWEKQSWTAFAIAGLMASTLSVFAVGAVRGIGDRLHQIAIVDATAGSREAFATAYFGVKTPLDKQIDVWLPSDWKSAREPEASDDSLQPLPPGSGLDENQTRFADPAKYRLVPGSAVVEGVRLRATLKRFEGRWEGSLDGDVTGLVRVRRGEIVDGSYITNNLGFPLQNAVLLVPQLDPGGVVPRSKVGDATFRSRAGIDACQLGAVDSADGAKVDLALLCAPVDAAGNKREDLRLETLQEKWSVGFRSLFEGFTPLQERSALRQEKSALLLMSTVREFDPAQHTSTMQAVFGPKTWSRDRMRQLDITDELIAGTPMRGDVPGDLGTAVLIAFADDPGPLRLFSRTGDRDFHPLDPESEYSWSMWRIRIPIERLDREASEMPETDSTSQ